jgi:CPA1 family monovalent cation:H+ antiporter
MGGYTLAELLHISGPLAMVAAGLITGNAGRERGMSIITADYLNKFWELVDEVLNAILFVLIGLEVLIIQVNGTVVILGLIAIVLALLTRYISLLVPSLLIRFHTKTDKRTLTILTWGGLRGGISIALALSLKPEFGKELWVTITYIIVCFSILVQGLTVGKLAGKKPITE